MRVAILDLFADGPLHSWGGRLYARYFLKQFMAIMPQATAVWCRSLGHEVHYATYYGQKDPMDLVPRDVDVLFVSSYTQCSALAYALAAIFRRYGVLTVIGGPHARAFPTDCLRFFDIAVKDCDKTLIADILDGHFDPPAVVTSGRALSDFPTVEERMPEIRIASFQRGRPLMTSMVPLLASTGCPYACGFCIDWNTSYAALPRERDRLGVAPLASENAMARATKRRKYRKKASQSVLAVQLDIDTDGFSYRKWGGKQRAKRGDWLVDNDGDIYTVDAKVFARTYQRIRPGIYVKTTPVWAEVATEKGSVKTKEGESHYRPGDYLVYNDKAGRDGYRISAAKFRRMYRLAR